MLPWARYRGWRSEDQTPDGENVRLRMRFDIEEEALQFAPSYGTEIEVLDLPELRGPGLGSSDGDC